MSDGTPIEWTDATVNAVSGCSVISPGCTNCYAMRAGGRNLPGHPSTGLTQASKAGHVWTGEVRLSERALLQPLRWRRPRRIFWNAHGDLFHENVPDAWIEQCFAVMAMTPHHTHQVLTKRSARMRAWIARIGGGGDHLGGLLDQMDMLGQQANCGRSSGQFSTWPLPNVWLGVSVEDQARAGERVPDLLATPATVRFLSCEPLLGPVDLGQLQAALPINAWLTWLDALDWVIVGGESGRGARPMHPDWVRSLRDQCAATGVPFHFKQWGAFAPLDKARPVISQDNAASAVAWPDGSLGIGSAERRGGAGQAMYLGTKSVTGRLIDGVQHDGMPA